jgi:hypothetical protein
MGAVEHLINTTQLPIWEDLQAVIVEAKKQIQSNIDPETFDIAWKKGEEMGLERMIAYAMQNTGEEEPIILTAEESEEQHTYTSEADHEEIPMLAIA